MTAHDAEPPQETMKASHTPVKPRGLRREIVAVFPTTFPASVSASMRSPRPHVTKEVLLPQFQISLTGQVRLNEDPLHCVCAATRRARHIQGTASGKGFDTETH